MMYIDDGRPLIIISRLNFFHLRKLFKSFSKLKKKTPTLN